MPIVGYLHLSTIDGDVTAAGYEDQIAVSGLSWGLRQTAPGSTGSGRARARAEFDPLRMLKIVDVASPYLAQAVSQRRSFDEATLTVMQLSGGAPRPYFVMKMARAVLNSYEIANDGPEDPQVTIAEELGMIAERATITYFQYAEDGTLYGEHEVEIDMSGRG